MRFSPVGDKVALQALNLYTDAKSQPRGGLLCPSDGGLMTLTQQVYLDSSFRIFLVVHIERHGWAVTWHGCSAQDGTHRLQHYFWHLLFWCFFFMCPRIGV